MRTKGSPNLTKEKRATIKAQKNLRLTTQKQIAEEHGIAEMTVRQIERNMKPDELALAAEIEREHKEDIKRVRNKALNKLEVAIDTDRIKPEALIPAYGTLYDKFRLETGQPTNITQTIDTPGKCKSFIKDFLTKQVCEITPEGIEVYRRPTLKEALIALYRADIGLDVEERDRWIEGEMRLLGK